LKRRPAVDLQILQPRRVDAQAQSPRAMARLQVFLPQLGGLEHVPVGVDYVLVARAVHALGL
jgi:hypothetical protein